MARSTFDERAEYRGGALTQHEKPPARRYPCFANGCPMPGTIWPGAVQGGTGDEPGTCAWHYGVQTHDIPKVTRVLLDWQCVSFEVNEARRAHTSSELACNPKALADAFAAAWERLQPQVGEWAEELRPGTARNSRGDRLGHREDYASWARRLERFLGARVVEVLSVHRRRAA